MRRRRFIGMFLLILTGFSPVLAAVTMEIDFQQPAVETLSRNLDGVPGTETYHRVTLKDCPLAGNPGYPLIPHRPVSLLIPQGEKPVAIEVVCGEWESIPGTFTLMPSQREFPLSRPGDWQPTAPLKAVYQQDAFYPEQRHSPMKVFWCKGYQIVNFNVFPVRFNPVTGEMQYTRRISVTVTTQPGDRPVSVVRCRDNPEDRRWVARKVENPGLISRYHAEKRPSSSHLNSRDTYEYVIITTNAILGMGGPNNFQDFLAFKYSRGITGTIKTVEEIYAEYSGVDNAEKIRNFCIDAYNQWDTQWILLGSDVPELPTRGCYATSEGHESHTIPTDMYFGCLDGSWDYNGNGVYGELGDGPEGGDPDVYAELFVGRASVDAAYQLHNFVQKTIAYETDDYQSESTDNALLLGEYLWTDTYGAMYMDELWFGSECCGYYTVGYPDDWEVDHLYEREASWGASTLIPKLNSNDLVWVNHLGHANEYTVMHLDTGDVDGLTNSRPFIVYSQGCEAGAFDTEDCIAEHFSYSEHGAFAVIMNGRYGWGEIACTDGSSQYFHRQFHDAYFAENIRELGKMNQDSKEDNVWCLDYKANRWCCYELNLLGCPQTPIRGLLGTRGSCRFDRTAYSDGDTVTVTVTDVDLNLSPDSPQQVSVTITVGESGDTETLTLTETGDNTSTFAGTMDISSGSYTPGNDHLETTEGDEITVTYIDENDGFGGVNVPVTDTALADFTPPVITGVHVGYVNENTAYITWETDEPCRSRVVYDLETPPVENESTVDELKTLHTVRLDDLEMCSTYYFYVESTDDAGNATTDTSGGEYYSLTTRHRVYLLDENMNIDPQWTITGGDWEWGQPQGNPPGPGHDPSWGCDRACVYGTNLNGAYQGGSAYHLVTPPIDCSDATETRLEFCRWLDIEANDTAHASVSISTDGVNWLPLYENPGSNFYEYRWTHVVYDISGFADGHPEVYIRWTIQSSGSGSVGGWNIDNVQISYPADCDAPILFHEDHLIDDSSGNGDGHLNPGESIDMDVILKNMGLDASNVTAQLTTTYPHVEIQNDTSSFGDMAHGETAESETPYRFNVMDSAADKDMVAFVLQWESAESSGEVTFNEAIYAPELEIDSLTILDNFGDGDGDGFWDPGETVKLVVTLSNVGRLDAANISGHLETDHGEWITVDDADAGFPDIAVGESGTCESPCFMVTSSPSTPDHTLVEGTFDITADGLRRTLSWQFDVTTSSFGLRYRWPLDEDPGWTTEGEWAFGVPLGIDGDPSSGYTGENVYGYNLAGDYPNSLPETALTTTAINCSSFANVEIRFMRWLGVESSSYDHASFEVSNDARTWHTIWTHTEGTFTDGEWIPQAFDISEFADHEPEVYLRWVMGPTDASVTYCGWNIDDVELWADTTNPQPLLEHMSHTIDDTSGNGDGHINPTETISMEIGVHNYGTAGDNFQCYLTTDNPHVTMITDYAELPAIPANGEATTLTPFEFEVSSEAQNIEVIMFTMNWFSDKSNGSFSFPERVFAPAFQHESDSVEDSSTGDGDGIIDPGETVDLVVTIENTGLAPAADITAILSSDHPEYITVNSAESTFPDMENGESGSCETPFNISVSPSIPDHTLVTFSLDITCNYNSTQVSFEKDVTVSTFALRYEWTMDTDPEWLTDRQWEWGVPQGNSGDPDSGYTGTYVYGYNLAGNYENNLPEVYLTTNPIDCSNLSNVEVRFMRWLSVESASYDHAAFRVSNDGATWTTLWEHTGGTMIETEWQSMSYDISEVADGEPTVYLRWVMGTTDSSVTYCGWNIDDVEIWGEIAQPEYTPTPEVPTATPTPFICVNDGDVNGNGELTPEDALGAFQIYLQSYPDPSPEEVCAADCNGNDTVTPEDALCIFRHYLSGECDCVDDISRAAPGNPISPAPAGRLLETREADIRQFSGNTVVSITAPVSRAGFDAFGFSFRIPEGYELVSVLPGPELESWLCFDYAISGDTVTVGGFNPLHPTRTDDATIEVAEITLHCSGQCPPPEIHVFDLKDDMTLQWR